MPFTVPSVDEDGEISLIISCAAAVHTALARKRVAVESTRLTERNTCTTSNNVIDYNQDPENNFLIAFEQVVGDGPKSK
jgi:hypothetical protein